MPIAVVILLLDLTLVVHAAKTGRLCPWGYIILAIPGLGALAYIGIEVIPEWMGSIQGQKAQTALSKTLDPNKKLRELCDQFARADTIANRIGLANECLRLGHYDEALEHFDTVLRRPMGDEPTYMLGKAKAQFGLGRFEDAITTLEELTGTFRDFDSAEGHLLYARSLEAAGRTEQALVEYDVVSGYFPGAEARVRFGMLLVAAGRTADGRAVFSEVLERIGRMPKYVRKVEAEWIALAEKALKI
jgi:hypothetical protein